LTITLANLNRFS